MNRLMTIACGGVIAVTVIGSDAAGSGTQHPAGAWRSGQPRAHGQPALDRRAAHL